MGSLRSRPAQGYPPADLTGFPTTTVPPRLYRAHRREHGPWWFSTYDPATEAPSGRFHLSAPRGTCYLASTALGAAREFLGHHVAPAVHVDDGIRSLVISGLDVDWPAVADLEHPDAPRYGVTRELSTTGPYRKSAAWAAALSAVAAGVRYILRFGVSADGYALFATAGERPGPVDPDPLPLVEVLEDAGYELVGTPRQLPVIEPRF